MIIHEIDTARTNDARLVVPGQSTFEGNGGAGALWQPGMTFVSAADNVAITVQSFAPDGTARVTVAPFMPIADTWPPGCALPAGWVVSLGVRDGGGVPLRAEVTPDSVTCLPLPPGVAPGPTPSPTPVQPAPSPAPGKAGSGG